MKKILLILALLFFVPMSVMAETGEIDTNPIEEIEDGKEDEDIVTPPADDDKPGGETPADVPGSEIPGESAEDKIKNLGDKIIYKCYEVATTLQKMAVPISISVFAIGAFLMLFGSLGKMGMTKGIVVCVMSIVCYALCMNAPQIIVAVSQWLTD